MKDDLDIEVTTVGQLGNFLPLDNKKIYVNTGKVEVRGYLDYVEVSYDSSDMYDIYNGLGTMLTSYSARAPKTIYTMHFGGGVQVETDEYTQVVLEN